MLALSFTDYAILSLLSDFDEVDPERLADAPGLIQLVGRFTLQPLGLALGLLCLLNQPQDDRRRGAGRLCVGGAH